MKLMLKTSLVVGITMMLFIITLFFIIQPLLLKDSIELDKNQTFQDIERINNNLTMKAEILNRLNRDWAIWDETYLYLSGQKPDFMDINLLNGTYENNRLNLMVFLNNKEELFFQKVYDLTAHKQIVVENDFYKKFLPIIQSSDEMDQSLIVMTEYGPALISLQSVYKSNGEGPSVGTLVMGQFINKAFINQIGDELSLPLTFEQISSNIDYKSEIEVLSDSQYKGAIVLQDYLKNEVLEISFITERQFYLDKLSTIKGLYKYIVLIGLIFILLVLGLLNKYILSRVRNLSSQLNIIQNNKDIKSRVAICGQHNDEITELRHSINHMLSSLDEKNNELLRLAYYDQLTKIPNRNVIFEQFPKEISNSSGKVALIFIDLDGFKRINDSLGHKIGDALLVQVCERILWVIDKHEGSFARFGGDEFVILQKYNDKQDLELLVQTILSELGQEYWIHTFKTIVTASIGISLYPNDGTDLNMLLQKADIAMYEAKRNGKNQYFFFEDLERNSDYLGLLILENDLKFALQRNQLELYYQVIVNGSDENIVGVEALLRWNHPTKGLIPPDKFIPIAEEIGLMPSIGLWVLEESIKQINKWHYQGLDKLSLAINISKSQMRDLSFLDELDNTIKKYHFDPSKLQIEITESVVDHYLMEVLEFTRELSKRKVRVALDDFGAGTSSLLFLKELPINVVKIDRNFIKNVPVQSFDSKLLSGIIEVFKELNLDVVVEGIETDDQLKFVNSRIEAQLQGYYFSRPLPSAVVEEELFGLGKVKISGQ
jgi:diguanylate cyclase (GGDEF)-like protein